MLVAPVALIVVVLGSILGGLATPTEAAAVGAFGAMLLTARKVDPVRSGPAMIAVLAIVAVLALRSVVDLRLGRIAGGPMAGVAIAIAFALLRLRRLWDVRRRRDDRARQDPRPRFSPPPPTSPR